MKSEKLCRRGYLPIQYIFPHLPYGESAFRQVMKMDFKSTQINVQSKGMYEKKGKEQQKIFKINMYYFFYIKKSGYFKIAVILYLVFM